MRLLLAAGIVKTGDLQEASGAPAVADVLTRAALDFIAAGGVLSLADWTDLLPCERAAFLAARRAYDANQALMVAMASSGPRGAAAVAQPADGGAAADAMRIDEALGKVVSDARAMGPKAPGGVPRGTPLRGWDGAP